LECRRKQPMIPLLRPTIDEQTKQELLQVLDSGWWGQGPKTFEFEKKFADYVGAKFAIATNSGTAALDLCLKAYGIKGGELITSPMTFVADAIVGEWNGMDVTFADIDEDSLCLSPKTLEITQETKAIIVINSHGRLADIDAIREKATIADPNGIATFCPLIIEDCAHAMYTPSAGQKGDIAIWSFQAVKTLPTGDGGMISTNDEKIYQRLRTLTWLGIEKSTYERVEKKRYTWDYDIIQAEGTKAYMNDLTAVIGIGQLRRLEETNAKRRAIQQMYNTAFCDIPQITIPMYSHTVQYYTMQCDNRDELSNYLAGKGYATSVHFKVLHKMTYWRKAMKKPLPVADKVWKRLLTLPVHNALTFQQVEEIITHVKTFYKQ